MKTKINVLGVDYDFEVLDERDNHMYEFESDGYCDNFHKAIKVLDIGNPTYEHDVAIHEILHAFLYESGIELGYGNHNEDNVNWISLQFDKIRKAVEKYEKDIEKK